MGAASAADWDGWTYTDSPYERLSAAWVQDVQNHLKQHIYDPSLDFNTRLGIHSKILGWDERIDAVMYNGIIDDGYMDEETGEWIEGSGVITYDWGFWGNTFGWGVPTNLFQHKSEYEAAVNIFWENVNAAGLPVPPEV